MSLTTKQTITLLQPINPTRVARTDQGMSHIQAWDVRRWLIRIFGHGGFSIDVADLVMLYEQSKEEGTRWRTAYRATVRLTIGDATYTEAAVGTNMGWLPDTKRDEAHDMAIKTAVSQATKRCAVNLGDQFGLSLYANTTEAVVGSTVPYTEAQKHEHPSPPEQVEAHDDPPVPAVEHDPDAPNTTLEQDVDTTATPDPTEEPPPSNEAVIERVTGELVEAAKIPKKNDRMSVVTRISLEAGKAKIQQAMTSEGVTIAALVDRAFAGPSKEDS